MVIECLFLKKTIKCLEVSKNLLIFASCKFRHGIPVTGKPQKNECNYGKKY